LNFTTQNPDSFQINSFSDQSGRFADVLPKIIYTHELTPIPEFTYQDTVRTISFTNTSQNSDNYVWDFGDGNTSTEFEPVHQYEEDGTYLVTLTGENQSCDNQTYSTDIIINTISVLNIGSDNFVKISPNPFFNQLNAQFISPRNQTAEIEIFNQTGIRIYRSTVSLTCGENNFTIKFPEKPNQGIYFAKISSGTDVQIIKLINMNR
jgi:PKD repeat protein